MSANIIVADPIGMLVQESPDGQEINIFFGDYHLNDIHRGDHYDREDFLKIARILRHDAVVIIEDRDSVSDAMTKKYQETTLKEKQAICLTHSQATCCALNDFISTKDNRSARAEIPNLMQDRMKYNYDFIRNESCSFLGGMYDDLCKLGIDSYNAEFRFPTDEDPLSYCNHNPDVIIAILQSSSVNDQASIRAMIRKFIGTHRKLNKEEEYAPALSSSLVDMRAIKHSWSSKKKIKIWAMGSFHITNIASHYAEQGWKTVFEDGHSLLRECDSLCSVKLKDERPYFSPYDAFVKLCRQCPQFMPAQNIMIQHIIDSGAIPPVVERDAVMAMKAQYSKASLLLRQKENKQNAAL